MNTFVIIAIVVAVVIVLLGARMLWVYLHEPIKQEMLSFNEVVEFFREPRIIEKAKEDSNFVAVILRTKTDEGMLVVLQLYDMREEELKLKNPKKWYIVERLDEKLTNAFGDEDIIFLKVVLTFDEVVRFLKYDEDARSAFVGNPYVVPVARREDDGEIIVVKLVTVDTENGSDDKILNTYKALTLDYRLEEGFDGNSSIIFK